MVEMAKTVCLAASAAKHAKGEHNNYNEWLRLRISLFDVNDNSAENI